MQLLKLTKFSAVLFGLFLGIDKLSLAQEIVRVAGTDVHEKTALIILNGFGDSRKNRKKQKEYFETLDYDFFIPKYKVRKSLDSSVEKFSDFYEKNNLSEYK